MTPGMALFFSTHRCNNLCKWLRLRPFRLSSAERAALRAAAADEQDRSRTLLHACPSPCLLLPLA